jgi:hypothetical protein
MDIIIFVIGSCLSRGSSLLSLLSLSSALLGSSYFWGINMRGGSPGV